MESKIRIGIIGCSSIAERSIIPAIKKSKNVQLYALGSRKLSKAKSFAERFSVKYFGNYDEVLENNQIDAVYISLPIKMHEEWIEKSAKAGKHILCEKSSVLSFRSAKKILKICEKNNVKVKEAFAYRFHPQHKKIQYILKQGKIGNLKLFMAQYSFVLNRPTTDFRYNLDLGGGVLNDVGCYVINSNNLFFSGEPISVYCNLLYDKKFNIDVDGTIQIIYSDNRKSLGIFSYTTYFQSMYTLFGKKGKISSLRAFNIKNNVKAKIEFEIDDTQKFLWVKSSDQYKIMINSFIEEINSQKMNSENEFLLQAKVMEAARLSSNKNKAIFLDSIK